MALQTSNKVIWDDVYQIYSNLNTARLKFGFTETIIPNKQNTIVSVDTITDLKSLIEEMSNNATVGNNASTSEIIVPTRGTLLTPVPLIQLDDLVNTIQDLSPENSAYFGSYRSGFFSSNHSGFFATNFSVCSFRFSPSFSSNFSGFRATDFSGNHSGFRATFFSTHHSSHRSSNFSTHHSSHRSSHRSSNFSSNHAHKGTNFATNHARFGFDVGHRSQGAANGRFNGTHRTNGFR